MKCVILQPSYIPWRGYFDLIKRCDLFLFYDDVQYDTRGWRHRNRIKTPRGLEWLSIPVHSKGAQKNHTLISDVQIAWETSWTQTHLGKMRESYKNAPYFEQYIAILEEAFLVPPARLADLTIPLSEKIARELGITSTEFRRTSALGLEGKKTDRLIDALKKVGATHYLSGPSARDYIEAEKFASAGIALEYIVYDYPQYEQFYPPYDPGVTIFDLLFMQGPSAPGYIWR